jgi:hypothetical protein
MRRLVCSGLAVAVVAAGAASLPARAQVTDVGGTVEGTLELGLDAPAGFERFPAGPGEHELVVRARVTSTVIGARLSVADGDTASGRRLGRLANATTRLAQPLEAAAAGSAFLPLDTAVDPVLAVFRQPLANAPVEVRLRQRIDAGERPRGQFGKTILVTLSSNAP